jgi:hypothetical protein
MLLVAVARGFSSPEPEGDTASNASGIASAVAPSAAALSHAPVSTIDHAPSPIAPLPSALLPPASASAKASAPAPVPTSPKRSNTRRSATPRLPAQQDTAKARAATTRTVLTDQQDYTADYAVYNCLGDGSAPELCDTADILPVGSKSVGVRRYGHQDLIGSVFEWTLDWYGPYPTTPRMNYANLNSSGVARSVRGGTWAYTAAYQTAVFRMQYEPSTSIVYTGVRCARGG